MRVFCSRQAPNYLSRQDKNEHNWAIIDPRHVDTSFHLTLQMHFILYNQHHFLCDRLNAYSTHCIMCHRAGAAKKLNYTGQMQLTLFGSSRLPLALLYYTHYYYYIRRGGRMRMQHIEMPNLKSFLFTMPSRNPVSHCFLCMCLVQTKRRPDALARRSPVFSTHKFVYPSHMGAPTIESGFLYYSRYNAKQRVGIESSSERGHGELLFKDARLCFQRSSNLSGGVLGQPGKLI